MDLGQVTDGDGAVSDRGQQLTESVIDRPGCVAEGRSVAGPNCRSVILLCR